MGRGKNDFIKKLFEKASIYIILAVIFSSTVLLLLKNQVIKLHEIILKIDVNLYFVIISIVVTIIIIRLIIIIKEKNEEGIGPSCYRMRMGNEKEIPFKHGNVKWIAYVPNRMSILSNDEHIWLTGPFCPECTLEIKWKKGIMSGWFCERCNKQFKPIKKSA